MSAWTRSTLGYVYLQKADQRGVDRSVRRLNLHRALEAAAPDVAILSVVVSRVDGSRETGAGLGLTRLQCLRLALLLVVAAIRGRAA